MPARTYSDEHPVNDDIDNQERTPNRLVLCFDGTGNAFQGTTSDTNIVKLLNMFDRTAPRQWHYYQPGIGTYTTDGSVNTNFFGRIKRSISQTVDAGLATSFDAHVIAGYRFLMRYYGVGDRIYIFGFSRGAFTARFLARMISHVGLLSMGNEEMVPFAYKVYQDYEMDDKTLPYLLTFRSAFCRHEIEKKVQADDAQSSYAVVTNASKNGPATGSQAEINGRAQAGVKVHFLGLFDTVNSVGTFDVPFEGTIKIPAVIGTAEHVRHAVAIDERRVKFKPALLAQDKNEGMSEDIKEVWFPGNHGDIGGGWPAEPWPGTKQPSEQKSTGFLDRLSRIFNGAKTEEKPHLDKKNDPFQLSDIALKWMIDELDNLPADGDRIRWDVESKGDFVRRFDSDLHEEQAVQAPIHDTMAFGGGSSFSKTIFWKFMEFFPFIRRWEYTKKGWEYIRFPLNMGGTRDIPPNAVFHHSVKERMEHLNGKHQTHDHSDKYHPSNLVIMRDRPTDTSLHLCDADASKKKLFFKPIASSGVDEDHPVVYTLEDEPPVIGENNGRSKKRNGYTSLHSH